MRLDILGEPTNGVILKGRPSPTAGLAITRAYLQRYRRKDHAQHNGYRITHVQSMLWIAGPFPYAQAKAIAALLRGVDWTVESDILAGRSDVRATIERCVNFVTGSPLRDRHQNGLGAAQR